MERLKTLKSVVYVIAVILAIQLGLLIYIIRPSRFVLWSGFAVVTLMCIYLIRLSISVLNELIEANNKLKK